MSVHEIKQAIQTLTLEEKAEVAGCLHGWKEDEWDKQMKSDLAAGRLDKLLTQVDADSQRG